jgi:hypothetical protein
MQPDSADSFSLSTSRKNTTRRPIPTYNNKYNFYEIPPVDQDLLYLSHAASWPLYDNRSAL